MSRMMRSRVGRDAVTWATGRIGVVLAAVLIVAVGCGFDSGRRNENRPSSEPPAQVGIRPTISPFVAASSSPAAGYLAQPADQRAALSAVEVVQLVSPAVVTVVNERRGEVGMGRALEEGRGTGFIIDEQGHIVTNEHVVRGGDRFYVIRADGERQPATLIGSDRVSDLAVVRIEGGVPATVAFGDSDRLLPGQPVLAIGSPLGAFTNTVTDGIVSAIGRDLQTIVGGDVGYANLIQHNAAINPGNSGGPLFDLTGRVIGVNTLGISEVPGETLPTQGLFFAIPSNTVREIASRLIADGHVVYPYLGINLIPITPDLAAQADLPVDYGVYVDSVIRDGPAGQAGIRPDDIILAIGGDRLDRDTSLSDALFAHRPGETVDVTIRRGNAEAQVEVTLGERPPPDEAS
jgi:2-alkenal reductase